MGRSNENVRAREKEKRKSQVEKKGSGGWRARCAQLLDGRCNTFHTKAPV
jgi:hypothetical protein